MQRWSSLADHLTDLHLEAQKANNGVNAMDRPVTPLAAASGPPVRPARYAVR